MLTRMLMLLAALACASAARGDPPRREALFPSTVTTQPATARPGETVTVAVAIQGGEPLVALQVDLGAPGFTWRSEACQVNPLLRKADSAFAVRPGDVLRAIVIGFAREEYTEPMDTAAAADWVFACPVTIPPNAEPGVYPLDCSRALAVTARAVEELTPNHVVHEIMLCAVGEIVVVEHPVCAGDSNFDARVAVEEVVEVVGNALNGCPTPLPAFTR